MKINLSDYNLEQAKVGKLISAKGVQTSVYHYDNDLVFKIPKNNFVNIFFEGFDFTNDYNITQEYLSQYIVNTSFHYAATQSKISIMTQPFVRGEHLGLEHYPKSQDWFDFISKLREMYNNGFMIDIVGGESFFPFVLKYLLAGFRFNKIPSD